MNGIDSHSKEQGSYSLVGEITYELEYLSSRWDVISLQQTLCAMVMRIQRKENFFLISVSGQDTRFKPRLA